MRAMAMDFRQNHPAKREFDYGLENALAKHVRNRWPDKTIAYVQHEWDLGESEAAKVVYASASKNTLKRILHHRRGGFGLFVELLADATGETLEAYITRQAREAAFEAAKWEAEQRRLEILQARVSGPGGMDGGAHQPARPGRAGDASLGADPDGQALNVKSFAPRKRQ